MGIIAAIGGGELKDLETLSIDRAIVKLVKKKHPKVLFIPTASGDARGYWETFQIVYGEKLGCETEVLFLLNPKERPTATERKRKILSADIVYVGGGNTLRMLNLWRKLSVDVVLQQAYEKGVILSGLSAGAICWFRYGESNPHWFMRDGKRIGIPLRVRGLDLLPFTCSPHHIREKAERMRKLPLMMQRTPGIALALDDNAAVVFRDNQYEVITSVSGAKVQKVFREGKIVRWRTIEKMGSVSELRKKQ